MQLVSQAGNDASGRLPLAWHLQDRLAPAMRSRVTQHRIAVTRRGPLPEFGVEAGAGPGRWVSGL